MNLNEEEIKALISVRIDKAQETLVAARGNIEMQFWSTAANRLYYACFYMVSALLTKQNIPAKTHSGVIGMFSMHFVKTGIVNKEQEKLYRRLFELRQGGDYDDWIVIEDKDVLPLVEPTEQFIITIEKLIKQ